MVLRTVEGCRGLWKAAWQARGGPQGKAVDSGGGATEGQCRGESPRSVECCEAVEAAEGRGDLRAEAHGEPRKAVETAERHGQRPRRSVACRGELSTELQRAVEAAEGHEELCAEGC